MSITRKHSSGITFVWPDPTKKSQAGVFKPDGTYLKGISLRCGQLCSRPEFWEKEFEENFAWIDKVGAAQWIKQQEEFNRDLTRKQYPALASAKQASTKSSKLTKLAQELLEHNEIELAFDVLNQACEVVNSSPPGGYDKIAHDIEPIWQLHLDNEAEQYALQGISEEEALAMLMDHYEDVGPNTRRRSIEQAIERAYQQQAVASTRKRTSMKQTTNITKLAAKLLRKGLITEAKLLLADDRREGTVDFLKEKQQAIAEIMGEVRNELEGTPEWNAARSYWYAHILGALGGEAGSEFMGGSMTTMQDTIDALSSYGLGEGDEELWEDVLGSTKHLKSEGKSELEAVESLKEMFEPSDAVDGAIEKAMKQVYGV